MASTTSPRWSPLPDGFGDLLRRARLRAGLSRDRLAAVTQTSKGLVQALEEGMRPPSATMAARLTEALALDDWDAAVIHAAAVDDAALRTRRGIRHTRPRRPRTPSPTRAITVPTAPEMRR
ncbi:helix-turn-helix transcriptional regulator [Streptomyces luteolifulvus]|uniref:Helix-turn-helix transcriptional regulator n=1 Tax=Streptomyces luteolifulvus TaxID=2615112 RepID=A0A6H9V5S6_9ACTN|nr:helix-turn-helix transcriptional regulator [Streptomyces luteolifulvus]KAB1149233.1 helix-turn-helix transcriptional regulator [Streptomyces luteolifulvus]